MSIITDGLTWIAKSILNNPKIKARTQDWFVNSLQEARQEDGANNVISDPMQQHGWYNIAVMKIAKTLARAPFKVYTGDQEDTTSEWARLFTRPNPYISRYQLFEATAAWLQNNGECIWTFGAEYSTGVPSQIIVGNPGRFKHTLSKDESEIVLWEYEHKEKKIPYLPSEVIHFKEWNKWDQWRGKNPCVALIEEMNQDVKGNKSNTALLDNNFIVPGILTSDQRMSPKQAKEHKAEWRRQHKGASKHYDIAVLYGGMQYQQIGLNPADMQYLDMKKWNRDLVLARIGVPLGVVGLSGENTPLSGEEKTASMKMFWQETIIPIEKSIQDKLEYDLFSKSGVGGRRYGEFDNSEIPELQADLNAKATREDLQIRNGSRTINQLREADGLEPVPWGDMPPGAGPAMPQVDSRKPPAEDTRGIQGDLRKFFQAEETIGTGKGNPLYTTTYRNKHWWDVIDQWENIEDSYRKQIQAWFRAQRGAILDALYTKGLLPAARKDIDSLSEFFDDDYWKAQESALQNFSIESFIQAMEATGAQLAGLFSDLGVSSTFDIYDTRAIELLETRVNKGSLANVSNTMRGQLRDQIQAGIEGGFTEDQMADGIRSVYNRASSRAATIARTEIGGVINDSRMESFKEVGYKKHSWLSAQDGSVRQPPEDEFDHSIDGEIAVIGEKFSNGLRYPNDPEGDAGNVINCRCLTLPED